MEKLVMMIAAWIEKQNESFRISNTSILHLPYRLHFAELERMSWAHSAATSSSCSDRVETRRKQAKNDFDAISSVCRAAVGDIFGCFLK